MLIIGHVYTGQVPLFPYIGWRARDRPRASAWKEATATPISVVGGTAARFSQPTYSHLLTFQYHSILGSQSTFFLLQ